MQQGKTKLNDNKKKKKTTTTNTYYLHYLGLTGEISRESSDEN